MESTGRNRRGSRFGALFWNSCGIIIGLLPLSIFTKRFVSWAQRRATRHSLPPADVVVGKDPRPPIVYLRSFLEDQRVSSEEEALAALMSEAGPVVAVGKPSDKLPPLGASRFYVVGDDWQAFVSDLIGRAALVLVVGGATPGLKWELEECRKCISPARLIVLVPSDRRDYEAFSAIAAAVIGSRLPEWNIKSGKRATAGRWRGIIWFDDAWRSYLQPFERPNGWYKMPSLATQRLSTDNVHDQHDTMRHIFSPRLASMGIPIRAPIKTSFWQELRDFPTIGWVLVIGFAAFIALVIASLSFGDPRALFVLLFELLN